MKTRTPALQPPRLPEGSPLEYAPLNEQGVIYLFSSLARQRYGLRVERVQAGYPDCIAYRSGRKVRIEFEYTSRNFQLHRHDPGKCDWLVCWIHNWPSVPRRLRVIELRREFRLGFNVWFQPVGDYREVLARASYDSAWSVPSLASEGDLLLFYRTRPDCFVRDIFRLAGPVERIKAGWKRGKDWMAPIRRVCTLKAPLHLSELRQHAVVRHAGFVRGSMRGRYRASEYWPELYRMIISRNPVAERALRGYGPERVA